MAHRAARDRLLIKYREGVRIALAAMATLVVSCTSSHATTSGSAKAHSAKQLAREDGARDVAPYRHALAKLDAQCTQDQAALAGIVDDTFRAELKPSYRQHAGTRILDASRLRTMRRLTEFAREDSPADPADCRQEAAGYLYGFISP